MKHKLLYKTQAEFEEAYQDLVSHWNECPRSWLYDANCIGINEQWVDAQLRERRDLEVFKTMVGKLLEQRDKLRTGYHEYEWDVEGLLQKYRTCIKYEIATLEQHYLQD